MLEQSVWNNPPLLPQMGRGAAEIDGFPVHDGADDQIEAGCPESLAVERAIADFAALVEEYGTLALVRRLALVETGLTPPAQRRAGIPFYHEQGLLDAAEFPGLRWLWWRSSRLYSPLCGVRSRRRAF